MVVYRQETKRSWFEELRLSRARLSNIPQRNRKGHGKSRQTIRTILSDVYDCAIETGLDKVGLRRMIQGSAGELRPTARPRRWPCFSQGERLERVIQYRTTRIGMFLQYYLYNHLSETHHVLRHHLQLYLCNLKQGIVGRDAGFLIKAKHRDESRLTSLSGVQRASKSSDDVSDSYSSRTTCLLRSPNPYRRVLLRS